MQKTIYLKFCIFLIVASLLITFLYKPGLNSYFDESLIFALSLIFVFNFILFITSSNSFFKNRLRFDILFMIGFLIVHFQIPFFASIGVEPEDAGKIWINKNVINYGVWLSTMVGLLWMLGFLLHLVRKKNNPKQEGNSFKFIEIKTGVIDFLILLLFIIFIGVVGATFLSGAYDGVRNWGSGATYVYLLLSSLIYLRIIYIFINNGQLFQRRVFIKMITKNKLFFSILVIYSMIFFLSSDRAEIMAVGLILLGGYTIFYKQISLGRLFLLLIAGAFVFTILQLGRTSETSLLGNQNVIERGWDDLSAQEDINPTYELAKSNRNLFRAIDRVPNSHPYLFGLTHFSNIISVVPFLGTNLREAVEIPFQYTSSTMLFSFWDQGFFIKSGVGTEIIADVYINYGTIGTLIVFFLFGYFISYMQYEVSYNISHTTLIVYLILLASSLYINRAPILDPLKTLFYVLIFDFLFRKFFSKNNVKA